MQLKLFEQQAIERKLQLQLLNKNSLANKQQQQNHKDPNLASKFQLKQSLNNNNQAFQNSILQKETPQKFRSPYSSPKSLGNQIEQNMFYNKVKQQQQSRQPSDLKQELSLECKGNNELEEEKNKISFCQGSIQQTSKKNKLSQITNRIQVLGNSDLRIGTNELGQENQSISIKASLNFTESLKNQEIQRKNEIFSSPQKDNDYKKTIINQQQLQKQLISGSKKRKKSTLKGGNQQRMKTSDGRNNNHLQQQQSHQIQIEKDFIKTQTQDDIQAQIVESKSVSSLKKQNFQNNSLRKQKSKMMNYKKQSKRLHSKNEGRGFIINQNNSIFNQNENEALLINNIKQSPQKIDNSDIFIIQNEKIKYSKIASSYQEIGKLQMVKNIVDQKYIEKMKQEKEYKNIETEDYNQKLKILKDQETNNQIDRQKNKRLAICNSAMQDQFQNQQKDRNSICSSQVYDNNINQIVLIEKLMKIDEMKIVDNKNVNCFASLKYNQVGVPTNYPLNISETFDGLLINQSDSNINLDHNQVQLPRLQQEFQIKKLRNQRITSAIKFQKNIIKENLEGLENFENQKNLYYSSSIKKQKLNGTFITDKAMKNSKNLNDGGVKQSFQMERISNCDIENKVSNDQKSQILMQKTYHFLNEKGQVNGSLEQKKSFNGQESFCIQNNDVFDKYSAFKLQEKINLQVTQNDVKQQTSQNGMQLTNEFQQKNIEYQLKTHKSYLNHQENQKSCNSIIQKKSSKDCRFISPEKNEQSKMGEELRNGSNICLTAESTNEQTASPLIQKQDSKYFQNRTEKMSRTSNKINKQNNIYGMEVQSVTDQKFSANIIQLQRMAKSDSRHSLVQNEMQKNPSQKTIQKFDIPNFEYQSANSHLKDHDQINYQTQDNIINHLDDSNLCKEIPFIVNDNKIIQSNIKNSITSPKKINQIINIQNVSGSQRKNVQNVKNQNIVNQGMSPKSLSQQQTVQIKNKQRQFKNRQQQIQDFNLQSKQQQRGQKSDYQISASQNPQQKYQQAPAQKQFIALPEIPDKRLSCQGPSSQIPEKSTEAQIKNYNQNYQQKSFKGSPLSKKNQKDTNIKIIQPLKSQSKIIPSFLTAEKITEESPSTSIKLPSPEVNSNINQLDTIISNMNLEKAEIDQYQNDFFQKSTDGDIVIYDSESRIMTFRMNSKKINEVFLFQDLDFQEYKKQIENNKQTPIIGCNEVKQTESLTGKLIFQQVSNDVLLDLNNPTKNTYSKQQSIKDLDRVKDICQRFQKNKKIQDFNKNLYIPSELNNQYCHFYSRFDSGNLWRVVQKLPSLKTLQQTCENKEGQDEEKEDKNKLEFLNVKYIPEWQYEFDLYLQSDTNAYEGLMHWYYFKIITKNLEKGTKIKLNIRNLHRQRSLYEHGMLPKIFYENQESVQNIQEKQGWHIDANVTTNLNYFTTDQNDNFDPICACKDKNVYTFSFVYEVQQINENVYFAYDQPYTYNDNLRDYIDKLRNDFKYREYLQVSTLCKSLGGNDVRLITITDGIRLGINYYDMLKLNLKKEVRDRYQLRTEIENMPKAEKLVKMEQIAKKRQKALESTPESIMNGEEDSDMDLGIDTKYMQHLLVHQDKKSMIITSRVHSGEVQSSPALEGFVNFLISDDPKAISLRQNYIMHIVPMLNPDGVIQGNQRTDLAGYDMNRRWCDPSPWLHPVLYSVKFLAKMLKEERNIDVFCDMHGHFQPSRGFMYCCSFNKGQGISRPDLENDAKLRIIPHYLGEKNKHFTIKQSSFSMEAYKSGSSRQAMFNEFKILNSFTLESSFFAKFSEQEINEMNEVQKNIDALQNKQIQEIQIQDQSQSEKKIGKDKREGTPLILSPVKLKLTDESCVNKQEQQEDSASKKQKEMIYHYSHKDHEKMGKDLCETLFHVFIKSRNQSDEDIQRIYNHYIKKIALRNQLQVPQQVKSDINNSQNNNKQNSSKK